MAANAIASAGLYSSRDALGDARILLDINLLFGLVYLSWQVPNLRLQIADARRAGERLHPATRVSWKQLREGLHRSIHERNQTTEATAWGGLAGLLWMTGYFATLLPLWANRRVDVCAEAGGCAQRDTEQAAQAETSGQGLRPHELRARLSGV